MKKLIPIPLLFILFMGCFDYEDEIWLNKDWSGTFSMKMGVAESFLEEGAQDMNWFDEEEAKQTFEGHEGIELSEVKGYSDAGKKYVEYTVEFTSIAALNMFGTSPDAEFMGTFGIDTLNKEILFTRDINVAGDDTAGAMDTESLAGMFADVIWEYKVHFPYKVLEANTVEDNIDTGENTVTWNYSLASLMTSPGHMEARLSLGGNALPVYIYIIIAAGVILVALMAFFLTRKRAK
jgi:hypothetical protein